MTNGAGKLTTYIIATLAITLNSNASFASEGGELLQRHVERLEHAKELLGKHYNQSVVKNGESVTDLKKFILSNVKKKLPAAYRSQAKKITQTLLQQSEQYGFDPIFLMAMIENESSFNPKATGPVGEIGLMQLRPTTAAWIAPKANVQYRKKSQLKDPILNIKLGCAFLAQLREQFDSHSRLYLAAYNMGAKNVERALDREIWPKDYPRAVMNRYVKLYSELSPGKANRTIAQNSVSIDMKASNLDRTSDIPANIDGISYEEMKLILE